MDFEIITRIGRYINDNEIAITKDKELNNKINNIITKAKKLTSSCDLEDDNIELKQFLQSFKKMNIETFNLTYEYMNLVLSKSKNEIEKLLKELDYNLELGVFSPDRFMVITEEGKKIERRCHIFKLEDIITFFNSLNSQIDRHSINSITKLTPYLDESYCRVLLENIYKNDEETIKMITMEYKEWIKNIDENEIIYPLLIERQEKIIPKATNRVKQELSRVGIKKDKKINQYNSSKAIRLFIANQKKYGKI